MADHGTYAGYQQHSKRQEAPCGPCRAAATRYIAERRRKNPPSYVREKAQAALRGRALRILASRHQAELRAIMADLKDFSNPGVSERGLRA